MKKRQSKYILDKDFRFLHSFTAWTSTDLANIWFPWHKLSKYIKMTFGLFPNSYFSLEGIKVLTLISAIATLPSQHKNSLKFFRFSYNENIDRFTIFFKSTNCEIYKSDAFLFKPTYQSIPTLLFSTDIPKHTLLIKKCQWNDVASISHTFLHSRLFLTNS